MTVRIVPVKWTNACAVIVAGGGAAAAGGPMGCSGSDY